MNKINPERLKHYREVRGFSMERLAHDATVNKSTIRRIENAEGANEPRENTVAKLAKALGVSQSELINSAPPIASTIKNTNKSNLSRQLNISIGVDARNALAFIAARYGVKRATIVRLAPILFAMVVEDSFIERSEKLSKLGDFLTSLGSMHTLDNTMYEYHNREMASIKCRDIFGKYFDDGSEYGDRDPDPAEYVDYVGKNNPLAHHISQHVAKMNNGDEFLEWDLRNGPQYKAGAEIALDLAGGDQEIADMLIFGQIGIHEIPSELHEEKNFDARMTLLKEKRSQVLEERKRLEAEPNPYRRVFDFGTKEKSDV